jgi:O-antigen ligase
VKNAISSKPTVFSSRGAPTWFSNGLSDRFRPSVPAQVIITCALLIFSPLLEGGTTHLAVMVIRLVIILLLGFHLWDGIQRGVIPRSLLGLGPAVLAYLTLAIISTTRSPYTNQSLQWLLVLLTYAGLLYLLVSLLREWDHAAKLLWVVLSVGLLEAGWAVTQWWIGSLRPTGTFFNPNFLAGYLAAVAALLLGHLCYARWKWAGLAWWSGLGMSTLALLGAIVLTGSRGGMLAWIGGTAFVIAVRFGRKAVGLLLLAALLGLAVPHPLRERLWAEHMANPVTYARLQIWHSSLRQAMDHPMGIGLGLYQYLYPRYSVPVEGQIARYSKTAQTAHSEYLQMAVELGVASLPVFAWGVVILGRRVRQTLKRRLHREQRGLVVGATGAMLAILVHAAVDSPLHEPALAILLTVCASFILVAPRLAGAVAATPCMRLETRHSRWAWACLGAVAVASLAAGVLRLGLAWMAFQAGSEALAQQDLQTAIAGYETAVTLDPGKALYHSSMAAAQYQVYRTSHDQRAVHTALEQLQEAVALNPLDGRLMGLLGGLYRSLAMLPDTRTRQQAWLHLAQQAFEKAAELEPHNPFHHLELGRVLWQLGQTAQAEAAVRHAVDLEPNFLPGRDWLAHCYLRSGRVEAAQQEYQQIRERQTRYIQSPKDPVEENYLKVDLKPLEASLQKDNGG